jgi:hypothetical protein
MSLADPDETSTGMLGNAHDLSAVLRWYAAFFETDDNNASLWDPVLFSDINEAAITLCEAFEHAELAHRKRHGLAVSSKKEVAVGLLNLCCLDTASLMN